MGLQQELAAEAVLVVNDQGFNAPLAQLDRGAQPGRAAADDQGLGLDQLRGVADQIFGQFRQTGQPFQTTDVHPGLYLGHAGLDRQPVGQNGALGALAVGAENALGGVVLGMATKSVDAVGEQGRGDNFAALSGHFPAVEFKGQVIPGRDGQDGVGGQAALSHSVISDAAGLANTPVKLASRVVIFNKPTHRLGLDAERD